MPWAGEVDAIVVVGLPGQEGGYAVADALLGVREPAGRLVTSYPAADGEAPAWEVVPTDLRLEYTDGTFVGYRGFHAGRAKAPAWWFGHGLGYGSWDYPERSGRRHGGRRRTAGRGDRAATRPGGTPARSCRSTSQPAESDQPVRLVGWAAVDVAAGGSATVPVDCDARLWRRWDTDADGWARLADGGELLVARASATSATGSRWPDGRTPLESGPRPRAPGFEREPARGIPSARGDHHRTAAAPRSPGTRATPRQRRRGDPRARSSRRRPSSSPSPATARPRWSASPRRRG